LPLSQRGDICPVPTQIFLKSSIKEKKRFYVKKKKPFSGFLRINPLISFRPMFPITFLTVNGFATIRLEWNLGFIPAVCTSDCVEFPASFINISFFVHFILPCFYSWLFIFDKPLFRLCTISI